MSDAVDSDSWCTPKWLCQLLGSFDLDPCSNKRSHVLARHRLEYRDDGLTAEWHGSVFVNPPYSSPLLWCKRLRWHDGPWVALVKLDPTTRWFAELAASKAVFAPFRSRIKFERPDKPPLTANFPSVLVWRRWVPCAELREHLWTIPATSFAAGIAASSLVS